MSKNMLHSCETALDFKESGLNGKRLKKWKTDWHSYRLFSTLLKYVYTYAEKNSGKQCTGRFTVAISGSGNAAQSVKNLPAVQDTGSIPGSGRSLGEGNGNPLQYSFLENPMDRGAWQATARVVARVRHNLATKPPKRILGNLQRHKRNWFKSKWETRGKEKDGEVRLR